MISINLLPNKLRKATERKKVNFSVVAMFILLFIIVGMAVELLLATNKFLKSNLESLQNQSQAYEQYFDSQVNTEVYENTKKANSLSVKINKIQEGRTIWSDALANLAFSTPEGIKLQNIKGDKIEQTLILSGVADNRENLLRYAETLKGNDQYFSEIDLPSSYLSSPTNVTFEITATLTEQALKNE